MSEWLKNAIEALSKQNKGHIKVCRYKSNQPTNAEMTANYQQIILTKSQYKQKCISYWLANL